MGATDVSFVNRQKGSGSRVLLDYRLGQAGIAPEQVRGYRREEYTHWAVAMAVQSGLTDCGLGIYSAAATMGLDFIPLEEEEFDLLIPEEHVALPAVRSAAGDDGLGEIQKPGARPRRLSLPVTVRPEGLSCGRGKPSGRPGPTVNA